MNDATRRIHIVGGPGSGKTTLASSLAEHFSTSAHHLDDVALSEGAMPDFRPKRALSLRRRDVGLLSDNARWVTEGSYLWWTEVLFERADVIVWLDAPWPTAARRIVNRHARDYFSDIVRAPRLRLRLNALRHPHFRSLVDFLRWSSHYYAAPVPSATNDDPDDMRALTRATTREYLGRFGSKVVRLVGADSQIAMAALEGGSLREGADLRSGADLRAEPDVRGRGPALP